MTLQYAVDVLAASIRVCGGVLQGGEVALLNALLRSNSQDCGDEALPNRLVFKFLSFNVCQAKLHVIRFNANSDSLDIDCTLTSDMRAVTL